ncbi:MAG: hypothetical protein FWC93_03265 [Defluviitaleaceae bacterium]|nr:hypothetical protein [Defluviitaleaceae bacterium]
MKKKSIVFISMSLLALFLIAHAVGSRLIINIELTDDQIIHLARDLLMQPSRANMFDVPSFRKPNVSGEGFDIRMPDNLISTRYSSPGQERWDQPQTSADSRESARQTLQEGPDRTANFAGESKYYYAFIVVYQTLMSVSPVEGPHFTQSIINTSRQIVYKDRAVSFDSDGTPRIARRMMLNTRSVRDIMDIMTFFHIHSNNRHQGAVRVIDRQITRTSRHGGGFIYVYHYVGLSRDALYARLRVRSSFISRRTGEVSTLSDETIKVVRMP